MRYCISKETDILRHVYEKRLFFNNSISQQTSTFFGWNFQDILMMIIPIYGENFRLKFRYLIFCSIQKNFPKFSKKPTIRLQSPSGPNPLRIILVFWPPIFGQNINSKAIGQLGTFPRSTCAEPSFFNPYPGLVSVASFLHGPSPSLGRDPDEFNYFVSVPFPI
jgi:hypothetical protein